MKLALLLDLSDALEWTTWFDALYPQVKLEELVKLTFWLLFWILHNLNDCPIQIDRIAKENFILLQFLNTVFGVWFISKFKNVWEWTLKPTSRTKWSAHSHELTKNFRQKIALQNARKLHALKKQCAVDSDQLSTDPMLRWVSSLDWFSFKYPIGEEVCDSRTNQSSSIWKPIKETRQ